MNPKNQKNAIKKLVSLLGVASASVFLSFPALALINFNSSSFDGTLNNRTRRVESTERSRQLIAQSTSGTGQTGTGGTTSGNGQINGQQGTFEQYMTAGYAATQQRDYPTALAYFQRALQLRPENRYAVQAVRNVQGYIQRGNAATPGNQGGNATTSGNQGGNATTPANQGGNTTTPANQGGNTTTPANQGGNTTTPANQGGNTTTPANQGGNTTTPANRGGNTSTPSNQGGTTTTPGNQGNRQLIIRFI